MAKLTGAQRRKIPNSEFGLPRKKGPEGGAKGRFPMPDRSHAANAKARAKQMLNKGTLSKSSFDTIVAKANKVLNKGKKKGPTFE